MASPPTAGDLAKATRVRFEEALQLKAFGERCHALAAIGKDLKAAKLPLGQLAELLDSWLPAVSAEASFEEISRLIAAKAAGCTSYAKKFLEHPCATVRFEAARGGLLTPADAKEVFLSNASSIKLRQLLIGYEGLPADEDTVDAALKLFTKAGKAGGAGKKGRGKGKGKKGKGKGKGDAAPEDPDDDTHLVWQLMARATNEHLMRQWLLGPSSLATICQWLISNPLKSKPYLPQLARRFPLLMIDLVKEDLIKWGWYWAKDVVQTHLAEVLRTTFIDCKCGGSGPFIGYDPTQTRANWRQTLASWTWRHKPDAILALCKEIPADSRRLDVGDKAEEFAEYLMDIHSTRSSITMSKKIDLLCSLWGCIPVSKKTPEIASSFVTLLPSSIKEHRTKELERLVEAFWKFLSDVGRTGRKQALVGEEGENAMTETLKNYMCRLPAPMAVTQFFKITAEFEVPPQVYKYMQTGICKAMEEVPTSKIKSKQPTGRHDNLMQNIFSQFLKIKELKAATACEHFQALLRDARSRDVIQSSFDMLLQSYRGKMELGLLQQVVRRMYDLELQSLKTENAETTPKASLPVPVHWVNMVKLPKGTAPHVDFLLHVLHTGTGEKDVLGAMVAKYGKSFFWDALGSVLGAKGENSKGIPFFLQQQEPSINMSVLAQLDVAPVLAPIKIGEAMEDIAKAEDVPSVYFEGLEEAKRKTLGKDADKRTVGYVELIDLAGKDKDPSKAFADLLVFLLSRLAGEQKEVKVSMLSKLLEQKGLPQKLWKESLQQLKTLWKATKQRDFESIWLSTGKELVRDTWRHWGKIDYAEVYEFALEAAPKLKLPQEFKSLHKTIVKEGTEGGLVEEVAKDVFERSLPLLESTNLKKFWTILTEMSGIFPAETQIRTAWDKWSFVGARWKALLLEGIEQKAVEYAFVDILAIMVADNKESRGETKEEKERQFWEPLDCAEYTNAVKTILSQMASGEIPAQAAAPLLTRRMYLLVQREARLFEVAREQKKKAVDWRVWGRSRVPRFEYKAVAGRGVSDLKIRDWVSGVKWDISTHHGYTPVQFGSARCRDDVATQEITTLQTILAGADSAKRQILWQVVEVAATLTGPSVSALLELAISGLDARFEGMARAVARHYPFLNAALAKNEVAAGCCDVLTPLVEMWLFDDSTRDQRVQAIMKRSDSQFFLFFGTSFARHVSNRRQDLLHTCLEKLQGPESGETEFWHIRKRGPLLHQVASFGRDWRKSQQQSEAGECETLPESVQVYLWHPSTQTLFLQKALCSNDLPCLALVPSMSFANIEQRITKVLASYPSEDKKAQTPSWEWEVIQAIGAYSDIKHEIAHRFSQLPKTKVTTNVQDEEAQSVLFGLGRADAATASIKLASQVQGKKLSNLKIAVVKQIKRLGATKARDLIQQVMLPKKAGVGLQTAGLKLLVELELPNPIELYQTAWSKGKCPRDVAGIILSKVTSTTQFRPEEVRGFFTFFKDMADEPEECEYVATLLLNQLVEKPEWSLPYLPEVVTELAQLPGMTGLAMTAIKGTCTHVTETVKAITKLARISTLSARADQDTSNKSGEVLADLAGFATPECLQQTCIAIGQMDLDECDPEVLKTFVDDMLQRWQMLKSNKKAGDDTVLTAILSVWVQQLRTGESSAWPSTILALEARLARWGVPQDFSRFTKCLVDTVPNMELAPGENEAMVKTAGDVFERFLDVHLFRRDADADVLHSDEDKDFAAAQKARDDGADQVLRHWAALLAEGCVEAETGRLFARVPERMQAEIAQNIVQAAVGALKRSVSEFRQKRPGDGWQHDDGFPIGDVKVGSVVDGKVTNSSLAFGVFVDFGCVKDGKVELGPMEWKKYRIGDEVKGLMVTKVDIKANSSFVQLVRMSEKGKQQDGQFSCWDVALRAVKWLGVDSNSRLRSRRFATLAGMWVNLITLNQAELPFKEYLALLGTPLPSPKDCVRMIEWWIKKDDSSNKNLMREALQWLSHSCPEDAARLSVDSCVFNCVLANEKDLELSDVQALLKLCEANDMELPTKLFNTAPIARSLSEEAIKLLVASKLSTARLLVIHALWERHFEENEVPEILRTLKTDESQVVAAAAQSLLSRLEPKKDAEEED